MSAELETVWAVAAHLAELVAAHGLVEAGKGPVQRGARAAVDWLSKHLPEADQQKLAAVAANPAPGPAQAALALQINALLEAHPDLLSQIRALLSENRGEDSSMHLTVGDNSAAVQNRGSSNIFTVNRAPEQTALPPRSA
jgi:hypothetical protein